MSRAHKRTNPIVIRAGMTIGSLAAESDDEFLFDCFVYHPAVEACSNLRSSGMIIAGRTGSGKTAILRHIERQAEYIAVVDPAEMALNYVSNSDALRFVQAMGADLDLLFQVLWKHVLCLEFIRLKFKVVDEEKSRTIFSRLIKRSRRNMKRSSRLNWALK